MSKVQMPDCWILARIGDICLPVRTVDLSKRATSHFHYIDITSVDRKYKSITNASLVENAKAPSRARQLILKNDVLVSTVRPALNAVAIVPEVFDNEICSTGFCVLRANVNVLDVNYLFAWVRTSTFIESLTRVEKGIGYPAVNNSDIQNTLIPLPPLPEQRHIAAILCEVNEIHKLRQEANEKTQKIVEALFYDMFGDPVINPKRWKTTTLEKVCTRITDGTHQSPQFEASGIPFLFISNIVGGKINLNTSKYISEETYYTLSKRCPIEYEDILYSTVGSYGVPVIVDTDEPFAFQRHIALIKPDRQLVNPYFLKAMLNTDYIKKQAGQRVRGIAQGTLNLNEISKYSIYLPPLSLQKEFVILSNAIQSTIEINQIQSSEIFNTLYQSLLSQAFIGELTEPWREQNMEELTQAARERDALLQRSTTVFTEPEIPTLVLLPDVEIEREDLVDQLNPLQQALLNIFLGNWQSYFTANQLYEDHEEDLQEKRLQASLDQVRRELRTLATLGLIREITLPVTDQPGRVNYATVYRYPQPDDDTMSEDLELLVTRSM
jgi:type I restriction enzyme, S subunit